MVIQHNISAMMTNRQLGINKKAAVKRMERLSLDFKIADDAVTETFNAGTYSYKDTGLS